jgi:MFS family permease
MFGIAYDYVPFKKLYGTLNAIELMMIVLVSYSVFHRWTFMVVSCLIWITDGSLTAMIPAFTLTKFGVKRGPEVYGYMFSVFALANLFGLLAVLVLKPFVGFTGMFIIGLIFSLGAAFLNIVIDPRPFDYASYYSRETGDQM